MRPGIDLHFSSIATEDLASLKILLGPVEVDMQILERDKHQMMGAFR